jgi:predicted transcriptional regulator
MTTATATVRISTSSYEQLRELAAQTGQSMQSLMEEAISVYRRRLSKKALKEGSSTETSTRQVDIVSDELVDDPNVVAYEKLDAQFLRENAGKYAAICGGKLVALGPDRAKLLKIVREEHPGESCLVKKVSQQQRVAYFRRPWRVIKMSD